MTLDIGSAFHAVSGEPHRPPSATLVQALNAAAEKFPDRNALNYFGRDFSFTEVRDESLALAAAFEEFGVVKGDRVLIQLQNIPQFVIAAFAVWHLGAVLVPVSPMYRAAEFRKIAGDAQPKLVITANSTWTEQGAECVEGLPIARVVTTGMADFAAEVPDAFVTMVDPRRGESTEDLAELLKRFSGRQPRGGTEVLGGDTAVFTYTSGTTGTPKGALTTHYNLTWAGSAYTRFNGIDAPDHTLICTAPLVHITGLALHLTSWICEASRFVLSYRFEPNVHLDLMEREKVTWTTGAATAYMALLSAFRKQPRDLSSLRVLGSGGAPIPTDVARQIHETLGVQLRPGYGLTESTAAISSTPKGIDPVVDPASGIISVGLPMFDSQVQIQDLDGKEAPVGERGEVCVKGPGIISGYWHNDEANAETFRDGWLHTGDVGFVNEDRWLFIVDRTKNMIIASGYKVWPREVEDVLYGHPAVREVAVVGAPDEYRGETVKAFVAIEQGIEAPSKEELIAYCRERLASYKVPRDIVYREELPKNFNGKIQHRELKILAPEGA